MLGRRLSCGRPLTLHLLLVKKSSSFLSVVTNLTLLTNDATFLYIISSNIIIITTNYF